MTRRKGSLDLDGTVELAYAGPLDARQLVRTKEELLSEGSFDFGFNGLVVAERSEGKLYMLIDKDNPTLEASWKEIGGGEGSSSDTKTFIAEYNVTTAQEIIAYMDSANEPYAPVLIKRGGDYHTATSLLKQNDETVIIRSIGTNAGLPYIFTYTVRNAVWANSTYALQQTLVSGASIKTINGESVLGSGDITVSSGSVAWNDVSGKPDFANVATSGSYNDLGDKPTIPEAYDDTEVRNLIAAKANSADLAPVAISGSYNDLGDKPTIPEAYDDAEVRELIAAKMNSADLATVATTGSYNDLGDKPTIPEAYDDTALADRVTAMENGKANSADLAAVATSGSYNDLSDKPTIPAEVTVDDAMSDTSENPVQNKVVLAAIGDAIDVVETAIADRYTKAETDAKIAEAMVDVDNEHFHPVTALPDPATAKENHEYVLITYAQDGTTIESETHYLFYDGVFHEKQTQVSLNGYATETYVDAATGALDTRVTAVEDGKASLLVAAIPGGGGGEEINAIVSQGEKSVSVNYYKDGALPNTLNLNVDSDYFNIPTTAYVNNSAYDDTALAARVTANETAIADRYTKDEVDQKAAETQNNAQVYADLKLTQKQNTLVSGTNIKTLNGESILGNGNLQLTPMADYEVCIRDEAGTGNVVQIGTIKEDNDQQNLYQFFYRTDALANATVKTHPFANLLADYTINDFIDATGMTSNGIFIGNGRTDNDNRLVVQQFSKNNKNIQIRAYKDFSGETALIKVIFKGKKNV